MVDGNIHITNDQHLTLTNIYKVSKVSWTCLISFIFLRSPIKIVSMSQDEINVLMLLYTNKHKEHYSSLLLHNLGDISCNISQC